MSSQPVGRFDPRALAATVYAPGFLLAIGQGAALPFIPLFARDLGASLAVAGFIFALRGIGTMAFDVPAGVAVSRFGERRTLIAATALLVIVGIGSGLSTAVAPFALFVFLFGAGQTVFQISRLAYIADEVPVQHRGRAIALLGGVNRMGVFVGPLLAGLLTLRWGIESAFFLQSGVSVIALLIVHLYVRESTRGSGAATALGSQRSPSHNVYRRLTDTVSRHRASFITWGSAVIMLQVIRTARQIIIPLWGDEIGLDESTIGFVFGASSGIDMLLFYPVGYVMDRWGRKYTAVPSLLVLSAGLIIVPLADGLLVLLVVAVVTGLGNGLSTGIVMTLGSDLSPADARGEFLGVWRLIGDLGTALGPFVIGAFAQVLTLGIASVTSGLLGVVGAGIMIFFATETLSGRSASAPERAGEPELPRSGG